MRSRLAQGPLARLMAAAAALTAALLATGQPPAQARPVVPAAGVSCRNLPATGLDHAIPWPQQRLGYQRVWPVTEGAGITVAVVDTGVDAHQPFLRGAVLPGIDVINHGGAANTDCAGHGTFVAGIIAGRQLPGFGFAGVAPQARILPVRQANSAADGNAATLAAGIRAAVNAGAQVINVSIVTAQPALDLVQAVRYAQRHDVVIVAAAGNDFAAGNAVQFPAGFPGVLAVGAVNSSGQRASFSETGPDVSVTAPGVNLLGPGAGGVGLVTTAGGTSFATPFVAGVAALVRAYHPQLTAPQVIRRIEATADHPPGNLPGPGLGWGIVNPYAAVTAVLPGEQGDAVVAGQLAVPRPARPAQAGRRATTAALGIGVAGALLAVGVLFATGLVRRGQARGWQPGAERAAR